MRSYDVVVIGAGAAGLMCAIEAAQRGRTVMVLERAKQAGRKILMSGGGRCNFTNLHVSAENYLSHNPHFCRSALARYTPQDFIDLVERHNIPYFEKTLGQLFCQHKSRDIVNMLLAKCQNNGVVVEYQVSVDEVGSQASGGFAIKTSMGTLSCQSCVVATGGLTIPSMGSNPFGYQVAESFGLTVWPTRAGLVPLTWHLPDKQRFESLSGTAFSVIVSNARQQFMEAMLFTHRGLSGPSVLQMSSYWNPGEALNVDFFAGDDVLDWLLFQQRKQPKLWLKTVLAQRLSKKLVDIILGDEGQVPIHHYSEKKLYQLSQKFSSWRVEPNGTEGYRTAEVTLGGVNCDELSSKTMMAHKVPGLYFIGEVVDVTGWLGGYNFQWAWASGFAAGQVV
jgi:predicted Rossmann fold flavoprotein